MKRGINQALIGGSVCFPPRSNPDLMKPTPIATPVTRPDKAKRALRLPPAKRKITPIGQPIKVSAPIMAKAPRKNRINGEEPPLALNSPKSNADWTPDQTDYLRPDILAAFSLMETQSPGDIPFKREIHKPVPGGLPSFSREPPATNGPAGEDEPRP